MALQPVTNLAIGVLTRKAIKQQFTYAYPYAFGGYSSGKVDYCTALQYETTVSWTNNEPGNHYMEVWVTGTGAPATVHLAQRSQSSIRIVIQNWKSGDISTADRTVTIHVQVKSPTDQSPVTSLTRTISLSEVGSIPSDLSAFRLVDEPGENAGSLLLPPHTGLRQEDPAHRSGYLPIPYGSLIYKNLGTTPAILEGGFFRKTFVHDTALITPSELQFPYGRFVYGLLDGGFYEVEARFALATVPTLSIPTPPRSDGSWISGEAPPARVWAGYVSVPNVLQGGQIPSVTRKAVFEYWRNGFPKPQITSGDTIYVNIGQAVSYLFTATSPVGVTSYAVDFGTATGLTYDTATRRISGVFTTSGTRTITLRATNSYGTTTKTLSILVAVVAPVITSALGRVAVAGVPFTYQFTATNATSFSVNLNGVPGISYNSATRTITGAFTSGGTKAITLTASNADITATQTLNVTVAVVTPVITSALTADNVAGLPFTYTFEARNATDYSVAFGTTTALTYDSASRTITGAFTAEGTYSVSLTAANAYASKTETLVITARVAAPLIGRYVRVTSLTRSGTVATAVCNGNHGLSVGDLVNIVGATNNNYNGTFPITAVTANNALQYTVSGSPATPAGSATPDGILAGPGELKIATRAGDDFDYELIATNATNTAVEFGTSTGLSYSAETRRITGEITTLDPVQTLRLTAGNLLANTTRDLTLNVSIPVPRVTSALQVRAITGQPFSYVLNTVDATSVTVSFGTALEGLSYDATNRTLSGVLAESQAGQQVVNIALANEFASNEEQLLVNVEVPRLQDPQDVVVALLTRRWDAPGKQMTVYGNDPVPPAKFDLYGMVIWQNTEPRPHNVILTVAGRRTTRPSGSTSALVYLATWTAPEVAPKTINIGVQLTGSEFSSSLVTANVELDAVAAAEFTGDLVTRFDANFETANALLVPEWTGALDQLQGNTHLGDVVYDLADDVVAGNYEFVSQEKRALAVPSRMLEGQLYRAELTAATGTVAAKGTTYQVTWEGMSGTRRVPPQYVTRPHYNVSLSGDATEVLPLGTALSKSVYFNYNPVGAPPAFTATAPAPVTAVINRPVRVELLASRRATWTIRTILSASGAPVNLPEFGIEYDPPVFGEDGPERAYLVGTPSTAGVYRFDMTAQNGTQTASATVTVSIVASLPRTTISTSATIAREGWEAKAGDELNLAFTSSPALAQWTATGLPPGVRLNQDGTIIGRFTRSGTYLATVGAQGLPTTAYEASLPTTIKFVIAAGDGTLLEDYSAAARSPWLLTEWQLIDLHVLARSREVQSTMFEGGALRIKVGDALNFGIFFVDAADSVFALGPEQLRLTIRKSDNLDDLMIFKAAEPPVAVESNFQTYYELNVTTGAAEREVALEWAEENEKNEPLECVADLDWVVGGKTYSSRTFPVLLELDVTRP